MHLSTVIVSRIARAKIIWWPLRLSRQLWLILPTQRHTSGTRDWSRKIWSDLAWVAGWQILVSICRSTLCFTVERIRRSSITSGRRSGQRWIRKPLQNAARKVRYSSLPEQDIPERSHIPIWCGRAISMLIGLLMTDCRQWSRRPYLLLWAVTVSPIRMSAVIPPSCICDAARNCSCVGRKWMYFHHSSVPMRATSRSTTCSLMMTRNCWRNLPSAAGCMSL